MSDQPKDYGAIANQVAGDTVKRRIGELEWQVAELAGQLSAARMEAADLKGQVEALTPEPPKKRGRARK